MYCAVIFPPFNSTNCFVIDKPTPVDFLAFSTVKYLSKIFCTVVASKELALLENMIFPSLSSCTSKSPLLYLLTLFNIFSNILLIVFLFTFF